MKFLLTVTAKSHHGDDCNLFVMTETIDVGFERPSGEVIKEYVKEVQQRYIDAYPRVQGKPEQPWRVIIEVNLIDIHATEGMIA